jgi:hypothetical protein
LVQSLTVIQQVAGGIIAKLQSETFHGFPAELSGTR